MAWLSPAYPVGAFSYSSGIEWAVEAGDISDAATLQDWLRAVILHGSAFCDAVLFVHAHAAARESRHEALRRVAELAAAFAPSKERHLETTAQGRAFVDATSAAWPCAAIEGCCACGIGRSPIPSPSAWRARAMASTAARCALICRPRRQHDFRRRPPRSARPDRWIARAGGAGSNDRRRGHARAQRRSTRSAARLFVPISRACGTRRNIRGCSGHEFVDVFLWRSTASWAWSPGPRTRSFRAMVWRPRRAELLKLATGRELGDSLAARRPQP